MGRFINDVTGVVVSVADSKDDRFAEGWSREGSAPKRGGRSKKSDEAEVEPVAVED